jgi:hypothetical protein
LDLERNREQLKAVRRGEWTLEQIKDHFNKKESVLEELYHTSDLPHSPDEDRIKTLLLACLEEYYGRVSDAVVIPTQIESILDDIQQVLDKYRA